MGNGGATPREFSGAAQRELAGNGAFGNNGLSGNNAVQPVGGDEVPRAEYNLGGGEIGKRLPIDDDIKEDEETSEYMDYQEGEIDRILRDLYIQLDKTIMEYSGANYLIRPGVRALIYSPNHGYSCRGYRCEWRASHNGWYLRYYYSQNDTCRKRWTNTACR